MFLSTEVKSNVIIKHFHVKTNPSQLNLIKYKIVAKKKKKKNRKKGRKQGRKLVYKANIHNFIRNVFVFPLRESEEHRYTLNRDEL